MHRFHPEMAAPASTKIDRATLRRAWRFAVPYRRDLFTYLILAIVNALVAVLPPLVLRALIDDAIPAGDLGRVNLLTALSIGLALLTAVFGVLIRWFGARVGEGMIADTRKALFEHVQGLPIGFFTRTQTGALMSRLNNDVVGAQSAFTFTLRTFVTDAMLVLFTLVVLLRLSWRVTVLALFAVPLLIVVSKRVGKLQERAAREQMTRNAAMSSMMTERFNVSGALLVKLFGRPKDEASDFGRSADRVAAVGVQRAITGASLMLLLPLVSALGTAFVYWWGARAVIDGPMKVGEIVAIAALIGRLYGPLTDLASARIDFVTAFVSFDRIFEVLDAKQTIADAPDAVEMAALPAGTRGARVEFDHVSFRYPSPGEVSVASLEGGTAPTLSADPSAWVLHDVTFTAAPGTLTAVVGPSGAGKTTLSSLIPRLYDVTQGSVRINGLDVRSVRVQSLRDSIGVVTQDAHLFHDTIAANLRYANPTASDADLVAACTAARIHDLIASLPDGYATTVGERGYRLSGGEKARLALARVLLKDPALVVLDEATAHLDSETESQIQAALETALRDRTSIVIAHRLSTIQAADQILVVDAGRIVERGTHHELVSAGGLYAELYETQYLRTAV
jgi:ATP-binding cassette, subfamily B, bacterial